MIKKNIESPKNLYSDQPLYDTIGLTTKFPCKICFFAEPKGRIAPLVDVDGKLKGIMKNWTHTNCENPSVISTAIIQWDVFRLVFGGKNVNKNDIKQIMDNSHLQLRIVDRDVFFYPLAYFTSKIEVPCEFGWEYMLKKAIFLNPYENLAVNIKTESEIELSAPMNIKLSLQTLISKPIY